LEQAAGTDSHYLVLQGIRHTPTSNYYTDAWVFIYDVPSSMDFNYKTRKDDKSAMDILRKYNGTQGSCCWGDNDKNSYDFRALINGHARLIEYVDFKGNNTYNRMVSFTEGGVRKGKPYGKASVIDKKGEHKIGVFGEQGYIIE
jgi:hypothetical protein